MSTLYNLLYFFAAIPQVLPFWSGERATGWHSEASGHIGGITRDTTPLDIYSALVEGLAHRLLEIVSLLRSHGLLTCVNIGDGDLNIDSSECIIAGSGAVLSGSSSICQVIADVTNCVIAMYDKAINLGESTSYGVAVLIYDSLKTPDLNDKKGEFLSGSKLYRPRAHMHLYYKSRHAAHAKLYDTLFA